MGLVCSVEGRLHVVKLKMCNVSRSAEKFVQRILCLDETTLGAKHPYAMLSSPI